MARADISLDHLRSMAARGKGVQGVVELSTELPLLIAHLTFVRVASGR